MAVPGRQRPRRATPAPNADQAAPGPVPTVGDAAPEPAGPAADTDLVVACVLSGVAALGLELVWVRILGLAFGGETFGMLGVLTGFFGGLSIGAALFHARIVRSIRPALVYVAAELVIAAYALVGPWLMLPLADALPAWLGPVIGDNRSIGALAANLVVATLVLLPATIAMGATTAAVVEAWRRRRAPPAQASTVAWLYAANTFGATLGVVLCIHVLLPRLGVPATSAALGTCSVAAALLVARWHRRQPAIAAASRGAPLAVGRPARPPAGTLAYALLFFTGLAGIGLETVGSHVLAQVFENTVHTFANILAVYLLGTAAGAWVYAVAIAPRMGQARDGVTAALLLALALTGSLAAAVLAQAGALTGAIAPPGASYARRMAAEAVATLLAFGAPTVAMGATFSHLAGAFTDRGIGYALAINTLGASLAAFVFGLVLIPAAGYGVAFHATVAIDVVLFAIAAALARRHVALLAGTALACGVAAVTFSPLVLVRFPSTTALLAQHVSLQGVVSVTEDRRGGPGAPPPRVLQVDQRFLMGGTPGLVTQRMGQMPMLVARDPQDVLYLGVGTGITAGAALDFPVRRVTGVELMPQVLDALRWFSSANRDLARDPRVKLHASDARRFVRATRDSYHVIVADLYHPSRDGTSALYTREHYANIRGRLRPGGLFVQWLPLYQLRPDELRTIVRTLLDVFPEAHGTLGNYSANARFALVAWAPGTPREAAAVDVPIARARLVHAAARAPVYDGVADLLASYMLDANALRRYAGGGPLNTDATQRITFDAAGAASDTESGAATLASLLAMRMPFPDHFVQGVDDAGRAALRADVHPYAEAVGHYLAGEALRAADAGAGIPPGAIDAYLKAYAADRRFGAAVGKLLEAALQDPSRTRALVQRVAAVHPDDAPVAALRRRVEAAHDPAALRATVARFLATGGDQ